MLARSSRMGMTPIHIYLDGTRFQNHTHSQFCLAWLLPVLPKEEDEEPAPKRRKTKNVKTKKTATHEVTFEPFSNDAIQEVMSGAGISA